MHKQTTTTTTATLGLYCQTLPPCVLFFCGFLVFARVRPWGDEERRLRALAPRRCVDVAGSIMQHIIARAYIPTAGGDPPVGTGGTPWSIQPHSTYVRRMLPPAAIRSNPASGVCTQASEPASERELLGRQGLRAVSPLIWQWRSGGGRGAGLCRNL